MLLELGKVEAAPAGRRAPRTLEAVAAVAAPPAPHVGREERPTETSDRV
jgi:hypothetical protein